MLIPVWNTVLRLVFIRVAFRGGYHDPNDVNLARQNPLSYIAAMEKCVTEALVQANAKSDFITTNIIGIGIDATASTPVPVNKKLIPLAALPKFADNINAYDTDVERSYFNN